MKKFEAPEMDVVMLAAEDIITGSNCNHDDPNDLCDGFELGENEGGLY